MGARKDKLTTAKPKSLFTKPLTLDFKPFFKAMAKAAGQAYGLKWTELPASLAEALSAIGLNTTSGERASILIQRSLTYALYNLLNESSDLARAARGEATQVLDEQIKFNVEIGEIEIDQKFFDNPSDIDPLKHLQPIVKNWLIAHGIAPAAVEAITNRLPAHFTYALNREWREHRADYESILKEHETPFSWAADREWAWEEYIALLEKRLDESVFDEPFGLRQIYVDLNAFYVEDLEKRVGPLADDLSRRRPRRKTIVQLKEELDVWLEKGDRADAIRMLRGGPGSGKSAFTRTYAAHVARQRKLHVLHVPLHLIDADKDVANEIGRFVANEDLAIGNPVTPDGGDPKLLIIFDGLDELASQGKVAEKKAEDFVDEVRTLVVNRNANKLQLRVLLTGRDLAVQQSEAKFRGRGQVLTLLPYAQHKDGEREAEQFEIVDKAKLLKQDLRDFWWPKYGQLIGQDFAQQLTQLKEGDLGSLTVQPLLNFLVAFSISGKKDIATPDMGRAQVYANLIDAVYRREYDPAKTFVGVAHMEPSKFHRMLEEVALAAWHGDGRSTSITEVTERCAKSGLESELKKFKDGAEKGVTRLLAAFFFRQQGFRPQGDPTFVFTHKSFGEYLAACRIHRAISRVQDECARRSQGDGGWNSKEALEHWCEICGPAAMTFEHLKFLRNLLENSDETKVSAWCTTFTELFKYMLDHAMPMEQLRLDTFDETVRQSRNAEEALLAAVDGCADKSGTAINLDFARGKRTFAVWLNRIADALGALALECLRHLDLNGALLQRCNLYGANLEGANLYGANLEHANLERASLCRASLYGASLKRANLEGTNLKRAVVKRAILEGANLERANLEGANLERAIIKHANLERANLEGADFQGANLERANLERTNLNGANLEGANLERANLERASLGRANLEGANLEGANLEGASLERASLKRANLERANLKGANLERANLKGAILYGAFLERANLKNPNLKNAKYAGADFTDAILPEGFDPNTPPKT